MSVEVYIDGSCLNNGRDGAVAGIGGYCKTDDRLSFSLPLPHGRQTSNRAEIFAAIKAIELASRYGYRSITLITDSSFLIKSVDEWIPAWRSNGWRTYDGSAVVNRPDFEELLEVSARIAVTYLFVAGHSGDPGNDAADRNAKEGAKQNSRATLYNY
ncbi:Ribonuclease H1 [Halotydeus destructor]|nr:Ribonuclease H1 [Halotydeus destructor]